MDALIINVNEPPSLLRNDAPDGNRWIKIRLEGVKSNRNAIGARVLVRYGGKVQAQEVLSQSSYLSASDPRLHFGIGAAATADIEIHWPLGLVEKYLALAANRLFTTREGVGIVKGRPFSKSRTFPAASRRPLRTEGSGLALASNCSDIPWIQSRWPNETLGHDR